MRYDNNTQFKTLLLVYTLHYLQQNSSQVQQDGTIPIAPSKNWVKAISIHFTTQKMKFSIQNFFSKCDQIRRKLRIWAHLLKKSLMENFIFCAVFNQEKLSCPTCYLLLTHKKNYAYLTDSKYSTWLLKKYSRSETYFVTQSGHLQASETSDFFFQLTFLVSSSPSLITWRFPHSSSMNTSLGKSSNFPISIPSVRPQL